MPINAQLLQSRKLPERDLAFILKKLKWLMKFLGL